MIYIIDNVPFVSALIFAAVSLCVIFFTPIFSPEHKKYIRQNLYYSALLCLLTLVFDLVILFPEIYATIKNFSANHGIFFGTFICLTSYIYFFLALIGLFTALRVIPFIGKFLMWLVWLVLTVPFRLYYLVMNTYPTLQDILDLFSVDFHTSFETVTGLLNLEAIIKAITPNIIIIIAFIFISRKFLRYEHRKYFRAGAFFTGILIFALYAVFPKGFTSDTMFKSYSLLRETISSMKYIFIQRENFVNDIMQKNPSDNLVFILDESIRGDYLSINNPGLNTTPLLEKYMHDYKDNIFNYGIMISAGTRSSPSRITVMTEINQIPDKDLRAFKNPTIFDVAKANGYRTILINVQGDFPDLVFRKSDIERVDEVYLASGDFDGNKYFTADFAAADFVRKRLESEKGLFIFFEKIGVHMMYETRYPGEEKEYQVFMPKLERHDYYTLEKRRKVINSYKNAVRYNIDNFFRHLLGENSSELQNCTILYTSDHAQSFMEYGQIASHSTDYLEQALVPFIVFSTNSWVLENLRRPDETGTLSHMNIDPTINSILCRDVNQASGKYYSLLSKTEWENPPLLYLVTQPIWSGRNSGLLSTDINGKIIMPVEKYMY